MSDNFEYILRDVAKIRSEIEAAAIKYGRNPKDITLLAAIKYADTDEVNYLHKSAGINVMGENRVQQLIERYDKLDKEELSIHFIGSLQTNKVKKIVPLVDMIQSVDSVHLAEEISKHAYFC